MKKIEFSPGNKIIDFSKETFLVSGSLKNGEQCSALSCSVTLIANIDQYVESKQNIYDIHNHYINPFLGYTIHDSQIYFIYQKVCTKTLSDWTKNNFEITEENKIQGFSMIYQICYCINYLHTHNVFIGSTPIQHIMLTEDDKPILYGYGLQEIFNDIDISFENDYKNVLAIAESILPSTYNDVDYHNFCENIINFNTKLPISSENLISKIEPIKEYAENHFSSHNESNINSDFDDRSISSETISKKNSDYSINQIDDDLSIQGNDEKNENNNNSNSQDFPNDNNNNENDLSTYYDQFNEEKIDTSDPQKNIEYWKKNFNALEYNQFDQLDKKIKIIEETDNFIIYEDNIVGLKNSSIDYKKCLNIRNNNPKTDEAPQNILFLLEQNTKIVKNYPNKQGLILAYNLEFTPLFDLSHDLNPTEKVIMVIRTIYSLAIVESIYGCHGMLNKYMLVVKKTHKSKTPKVRILFSGMSDILAKKTDDMNSIQNIFEEIEFSTPILNEKMSKYSSFRQLYKELVSDFTWFHQETNVNEVVFNIFGSIIIGKHPLYNYLRPKYYKELELFCEMYHFNQSYYALDSVDNPVVAVKSRDKYRSMQVLSPNRDQNEDKTSQFQKLNPDSLNDDDLAYWAYSEVTGNHLIQNVEHGKQLLKRASENSAEAKYYLSIFTNDDDLLMKACEEKYSQAMVKIGTKEKLNLELIQQAVLLGNIDAFYYLGLYYFEKEEYKLAYGFFYRAASLNQSDAQWRIAMMLEKSMVSGIQDLESAEAFYLASAGQKNPIGLYHYARFEETYKDTNCNQIYKISADLGFLDAQIPVIAYNVSKKEMTLEEIFNLVDEKDSSISTELLFRIAYSLPKSKEEIASALRAKAKSQLNDNDTDKFYAGFGLSSVFQCLREMTELSADWESIMSIGIKRLSPSNKILCWAQDFPNPSIDTVFLISEETLIKTPKDAMIIRNKFTKLARQKEYANDPFFLLFYLLHIKDHHAVLDSRLEQFVEATKKN